MHLDDRHLVHAEHGVVVEIVLQYATGVVHLFVNGVQVLRDGEHTGAKPGMVVLRVK